MSKVTILGAAATFLAISGCVVVADGSGPKLTAEEVELIESRCGRDGWVDGRFDENVMIETEIEGSGPPRLKPECLILRNGQTVKITVTPGRTAEFRFPEYSPFAASLFRVDGDKGATLKVVADANCPIDPERFGCKYDVAEAGNSRREVLDPVILTRGGGGGE